MRTTESELTFKDYLGSAAVRLGFLRNSYRIQPGLYSLNKPDNKAPVFLSANYKLSFDVLRKALKNIGCFILVLDTKGINVWCAAGKGSFGTAEIVDRVKEADLENHVEHRTIIVPQLGAPGIKAHLVTNQTGFKVVYGPVEARDIPEFLRNKMKKDHRMRTKSFNIKERIILTPLELVHSWKLLLPLTAAGIIFRILTAGINSITFTGTILPFILGIAAGGFLTPVLLPFIPGRAFSVKGAISAAVVLIIWYSAVQPTVTAAVFNGGLALAASSFVAMNFTGSSTYTSLSGVKKEMRVAVPVQIATVVISCGTAVLIAVLKGSSM